MAASGAVFKRQFLERRVGTLSPGKPVCVAPDCTVKESVSLLQREKIGSLLVCEEEDSLIGIFTERDILSKVSAQSAAYEDVPIQQLMTPAPVTVKHFSSVSRALFLMNERGFRHLPIEGPNAKPSGILSSKDLIDYLHQHVAQRLIKGVEVGPDYRANEVENFMNTTIECLNPKRTALVDESTTIGETLRIMRESRASCLPIGKNGRLSGIFTERDYLNRVLYKEGVESSHAIATVMTRDPHTLLRSNSVSIAFASLSGGRFRHLPILDEAEQLVGIVSVKDVFEVVVSAIVEELQRKD